MKNPLSSACAFEPLWARLYWNYNRRMPNHRGKGKILRSLHRIGVRKDIPFFWRMNNGACVAISPAEGFAPWSVGWTCFQTRQWEPHIEAFLSARIKPGMRVFDIGANLGYFSAVIARAVGSAGGVWSFEPVPATFRQLRLCKDINALNQMHVFPCALGSADGTIVMHFSPSMLGSASIHNHSPDALHQKVEVPIRRLDDLWKAGEVPLPQFIKIDVEGHEFEAFRGGQELLTSARPDLIFEWNANAAVNAGWDLRKLAGLLRACGDYQFSQITETGLQPLNVETFQIQADDYVDIFATVENQPPVKS